MSVAPTPDGHIQNNDNLCTDKSIHPPEVGRKGVVDTRWSTFLKEEFGALEATLEAEAAAFVGIGTLEYHYGEWDKKTKWRKVEPGDKKDKRVYKAHTYTDDKDRPRRWVRTQPYPSGDTDTFKDLEVLSTEYETWVAERKAEAGHLTEAERKHVEAERAELRAKNAQRRAEREQKELDRLEQQRIATAKDAQARAKSITAAIKRWHTLPTTGTSNYLTRKKLAERAWNDVRHDGQTIEIALRDPLTDEIMGIQRIKGDGSKKLAFGSAKQGSAIFVTGIPPATAKRFVLTEGWGTGASGGLGVQGETPKVHFVAGIDADNLEAVYRAIKQRWPKARITIASDDDAGTAAKFDDQGRPKLNKGQLKVHLLAMQVGAKVAIPRVPGRVAQNVDFSDVHLKVGLEAVREQLLNPRQPDPMFGLEKKPDGALKRGYALAKRYGCTISVCQDRYLSLGEVKAGVLLLRAAMGTGKTEAVAQWVSAHPNLSVLALSHLRGLTADLAARLELTDYRDIPTGYERATPRSAYCVNSLWRLALSGKVQPVDVLFADEIEQLLRRLTSRKDFSNKRQCLAVLEYLVRTAKYVLLADAHIGQTTLRWIQRLRAQDAPHMVLGTYQPGTGRAFWQHERRGDVRAVTRDRLEAGRRVYYALNGLERAHEINGWVAELLAQLPNLKVLLICSDTAGDEAVKAFFKDPDGESKKYDLIIASPSVSTGVSVANGHFDVVCGEFTSRVGTPNDAAQALARVRGCPELHVWIDPKRDSKTDDRKAIRAAFWDEPNDDVGMADVDGATGEMTVVQGYAELYLDVRTAEVRAVNSYAKVFWQLVVDDGFTVRYGELADDAEEIEQHAREAARLEQITGLVTAPDHSDDEQKALIKKSTTQHLTRTEQYARERHELTTFYALPDAPDLEEMLAVVELDRNGDTRRQVRNLEVAALEQPQIDALMAEQVAAGLLRPDIVRMDHRAAAYRATLEAVGINPTTAEVDVVGYSADDITERWIKPLEGAWGIYRVSVPGWPTLEYAKAQPAKSLGGVLRGTFGVTHRSTRNETGRRYTLSAVLLELRRAIIKRRQMIDAGERDRCGSILSIYKAVSVSSLEVKDRLENGFETDVALYIEQKTGASVSTSANEESVALLEIAEGVPAPMVNPPIPAATPVVRHPRDLPVYESLRAYVRAQDDSTARTALIESFRRADNGDPQALDALATYATHPNVAPYLPHVAQRL